MLQSQPRYGGRDCNIVLFVSRVCCCRLVVVDLVQLYVVDYRRVGRYGCGACCAERHLVGDVDAVDAAGVHVRPGRVGYPGRIHVIGLVLPAHHRLLCCRKYLPRYLQEERDRQSGAHREPHHACRGARLRCFSGVR